MRSPERGLGNQFADTGSERHDITEYVGEAGGREKASCAVDVRAEDSRRDICWGWGGHEKERPGKNTLEAVRNRGTGFDSWNCKASSYWNAWRFGSQWAERDRAGRGIEVGGRFKCAAFPRRWTNGVVIKAYRRLDEPRFEPDWMTRHKQRGVCSVLSWKMGLDSKVLNWRRTFNF